MRRCRRPRRASPSCRYAASSALVSAAIHPSGGGSTHPTGPSLARYRPEWRVIDNPYGHDDPIVLLPAIKPDVALFHAPMADRAGNVWIGRERDLAILAHAAKATVVTVERLHEANLLDGDHRR